LKQIGGNGSGSDPGHVKRRERLTTPVRMNGTDFAMDRLFFPGATNYHSGRYDTRRGHDLVRGDDGK
jgi:hypothetical protein